MFHWCVHPWTVSCRCCMLTHICGTSWPFISDNNIDNYFDNMIFWPHNHSTRSGCLALLQSKMPSKPQGAPLNPVTKIGICGIQPLALFWPAQSSASIAGVQSADHVLKQEVAGIPKWVVVMWHYVRHKQLNKWASLVLTISVWEQSV